MGVTTVNQQTNQAKQTIKVDSVNLGAQGLKGAKTKRSQTLTQNPLPGVISNRRDAC